MVGNERIIPISPGPGFDVETYQPDDRAWACRQLIRRTPSDRVGWIRIIRNPELRQGKGDGGGRGHTKCLLPNREALFREQQVTSFDRVGRTTCKHTEDWQKDTLRLVPMFPRAPCRSQRHFPLIDGEETCFRPQAERPVLWYFIGRRRGWKTLYNAPYSLLIQTACQRVCQRGATLPYRSRQRRQTMREVDRQTAVLAKNKHIFVVEMRCSGSNRDFRRWNAA
ncbi:hypothetical protein GCM10007919_15390 [Rhizobium indigoferae]|nr:hypothetical protein GCM10007919_15390 [Rhizobium indigoferae]